MFMEIKPNKKNQQGFALLMTLIIVGVVLSVGLSLLDLSVKQVRLASNAKQSEIAFHAANAGAECGQYIRRSEINSDDEALMELGEDISASCFGRPAQNVVIEPPPGSGDTAGVGDVYQYLYDFTWAGGSRCSMINTIVINADLAGSGLTLSNVPTYIPGFPDNEKICEAGSRCTLLSVRGYNRPCTNTSLPGTIEREVLLRY